MMEDGVDSLCIRLSLTDLEQEEIYVEPSSVDEIVSRGRTLF